MTTIIDYGLCNLGSVLNLFKKIGEPAKITSDSKEIEKAKRLVLPGVGAFDEGVNNLKQYNLWDILNKKVLEEKTPILGICLGMQLITKGSEEGKLDGFGWIDAYATKFDFTNNNSNNSLRIPHMGWNEINICQPHALFNELDSDSRFYFVHSYHVDCRNRQDSLATCFYGVNFDAVICRDNVFGMQFHPEKSHRFGKKILENFLKL